jgi:hypothetical protein
VNGTARIALLLLVALGVALAANLVLLGIANGPRDPVGQLNPRAGIVRLPVPITTTTTQAPTRTETIPAPVPAPRRDGEGQRGSHQDD